MFLNPFLSAVMQQVQLLLQQAFNQSRPASLMNPSCSKLLPQQDLLHNLKPLLVSVT